MARPTVSKTPFGERLTAIRIELGHGDRKSFAALLGMNAETLGGYERGDSVPDHSFLVRYKQEFSVNLDWLITGEGEMFLPYKKQMSFSKMVMDVHEAPYRNFMKAQGQTLRAPMFAGGESATPPNATRSQTDRDRLERAVAAVEEGLEGSGKKLSPAARADLILAAYDIIAEAGEASVAQIIRLVKS